MLDEEPIDFKLLTVPTVVVQNLSIDVPAPPAPELQDLCKLPQVQLEDLNLNMAPAASAGRASGPKNKGVSKMRAAPSRLKIPRVSLEKIDLALPLPSMPETERSSPESLLTRPPVPETERNSPENLGSNLDESFSKVAVVVLARCDATPPRAKKRVSFTLPPPTELPSFYKMPLLDLSKYTIVGPSPTFAFRDCRVFIKKDDLAQLKSSIQKVEKPTACKLCGKVYFTKKKLNNHQERKHDLVPNTEGTKKKRVSFSNTVIVHTMPYHRCRKCLKVFETYKILKAHMKSQHKKRNCYVCDYCDKLFAERVIFKIHIKLHCERCTELFHDKRELVRHRRTKCNIRRVHRVKCSTCAETYFSNLALKDHSYSHMTEKKLICDYCKDHFTLACPLIQHLYYSHSKSKAAHKNYTLTKFGSLRLFTCPFCAVIFREEADILKHLESGEFAQFGTIEKKYGEHRCEYCSKKFKIEKNLLQHMWTHDRHTVAMERLNNTPPPAKHLLIKKDLPKEVHDDNKIGFDSCNDLANKIGGLKNNEIANKTKADKKQAECDKNIAELNKKITDCSEKILECNKQTAEHSKKADNHEKKINGTANGVLCTNSDLPTPKRNRMSLIQHTCPTCCKSFSCASSVKRHMRQHAPLQCSGCEESFAWPALLRDHRCLRAVAPPEMPFDDIRPEVPLVMPDNYMASTLGMDEELPATNDLSTQVDFEIPAPTFEFAAIPETPYAAYFTREEAYEHVAVPSRGFRYKVVRQEVPVEFKRKSNDLNGRGDYGQYF